MSVSRSYNKAKRKVQSFIDWIALQFETIADKATDIGNDMQKEATTGVARFVKWYANTKDIPGKTAQLNFTVYALGMMFIQIAPRSIVFFLSYTFSVALVLMLTTLILYNMLVYMKSSPKRKGPFKYIHPETNVYFGCGALLLWAVSFFILPLRIGTAILFVELMSYTYSLLDNYIKVEPSIFDMYGQASRKANCNINLEMVNSEAMVNRVGETVPSRSTGAALLMKNNPVATFETYYTKEVVSFFVNVNPA